MKDEWSIRSKGLNVFFESAICEQFYSYNPVNHSLRYEDDIIINY